MMLCIIWNSFSKKRVDGMRKGAALTTLPKPRTALNAVPCVPDRWKTRHLNRPDETQASAVAFDRVFDDRT